MYVYSIHENDIIIIHVHIYMYIGSVTRLRGVGIVGEIGNEGDLQYVSFG